MKAAVLANPPVAYGATLLCVLAAETEILYLQLGDGDILAVDQNGRATRPVPEDTRLIANQTTSLCQTSAAQDFRAKHFRSSEGAPPVLILVSSDGYSNSFQSDEDFLRLGPDYLELLRTYGPEKVEAQLDKILPEASRKGSGDDITLGFIRRMNDDGKPAPVPVPQTAAAVAQPDPPTAQLPSPPAKTEALRAPEGMTSPRVPVDVSAVIAPHAQPEPETIFTGGERAGAASPAAGQKPPPEVNPKQPAAAGKKPAAEAGSKPSPPATARKSAAATRSDAAPSETVLLRRKVFWLKVALAGFLVVALAAAGLAWWRPLWVNNFIHLKEPPPPEAPKPPRAPRGHPDGRTPYDEPRKEAPRTRGRTELRDEMWRWHSCLPHPDAPERCLPPTGASLYV
jgi:hypothetical protein